jgi:hypothetical protein
MKLGFVPGGERRFFENRTSGDYKPAFAGANRTAFPGRRGVWKRVSLVKDAERSVSASGIDSDKL